MSETDSELLERSQSGELEAFEQLMRRHHGKLFAVAFRLMRDRDLAGELLQESLYRAYKKRDSYRASGSVSGWLTRITVNTCLNELTKRQRLVFQGDATKAWDRSVGGDDPADLLEAKERRREIREEVERLSPLRRAILSLAAMGYGYDEISEATEQSISQVKSELFRARKKLRDKLKGEQS